MLFVSTFAQGDLVYTLFSPDNCIENDTQCKCLGCVFFHALSWLCFLCVKIMGL